nr:protein Skeletor, isoforms B/C-like isoform X1 [Procambarus clarkii]
MRGERTYRAVRLFVAVCALVTTGGEAAGYYGVRMGPLSQLNHGVKGEVYAVDSRTLHLRGFYYDGQAPDAFFYAGSTPRPSDAGFIIPDEKGGKKPLGRYSNQDVTITLPEGKTLKDITWFSIWCRAFAVDFGHVIVDKNLNYPRPQKIDSLPTLEHGVTSDRIVVVDAQTFLIPNFSYDGAAPDAYFWVGKGSNPGPSGILVPDENGSEEPLKRYSGKTIVITLPGDLTVFDIDFLGVWCRAFHANFGHVRIPKSLNVPPSLKMLGVAPQTKLNCEVLWDDLALEVRWAVAGESIVMQLVARISDGQYMSFGTSGSLTRSVMVGGDVVVAWLDQTTGRGVAEDYHLTAKAQCQGGQGSCPDEKLTGGSNNVRLLNAALINDFTMLTFQRPLRAVDRHDAAILTNGSQAVIWAVGPINSQGDTSYHSLRLRGDMFIDFGRTPKWNCPLPEEQSSTSRPAVSKGPVKPAPAAPAANPWYIPPIPCYEPEDGVFYAQIGPTGGTSGYNSITGHVGWGISWYINGLLIPEINVVRGKSYTFVVEGGFDPEVPSRYHPFYITDDPEGGYEFKTPAERSRVKVLAGVEQDRDGSPVPSAYGRLCEWHEDPNQPASTFTSFGAYQRTLKLDCQEGQPGVLQWTPDANTPDTVYYQCYTHRFLGWKINVLDQCDYDELAPAGSVSSAVVLPGAQANPGQDYDDYDYYSDDRGGEGLHAAGSRPPRPHRQPQDHSNRISQGAAKPTRSSESRDPKPQPRPQSGHLDQKLPHDFPLVNFPQEFQGGFESFPFNMSPDDIGPVGQRPFHPDSGSSAQNVPLGVPGFIFPKLPNLKSSTGVVNATAFANLGNANLGSVPRDVPKEFLGPQKGDLEFSQHKDENFQIRPLRNKYPSSPKPTQQTTRFTSLLEPSTPRLASPKNDFPLQFTLSTSSKISVGSSGSIPTRTTVAISDTSSNEPEKEISNEYFEKTKTFTRPDATRQPAPTIPTRFPTSDQPTTRSRQTISVNPTIPFMLSMTTNHPTNTEQPTNPTLSNKFNVTPKQSTSLVPSSTSLQQTRHQPLHREPEVITAPSLPLLPFQAPLAFQGPSSGRRQPNNGGQIYKTTPAHTTESPATTLDESFAQNFGFDPESVEYQWRP